LKKIIFIGGSNDHVPFIEAAKDMGYFTVVFDRDEACDGGVVSDAFYKISTHDIEHIIFKCKDLNKENEVRGVMTYSSATEPLVAVAKVCELLGLPSFTTKTINIASDKILMKECFKRFDVPTPKWTSVNEMKEAIHFFEKSDSMPLIMKPSSGAQGSIGVFLVKQLSDIVSNYQNTSLSSSDSKVIIEEYYQGKEFSVDGIVMGGELFVFSVSEKHNLGSKFNFVMSGFSIIKTYEQIGCREEKVETIKQTALKAVRAMGITNSFFSVDVIDTSKGLMVLECGVLLDCKIDKLLRYVGVDVYKKMIKVIVGDNHNPETSYSFESAVLSFLFANKKGVLKINSQYINEYDGTIEWEKSDGEYVRPPQSIDDAIGWSIDDCNHHENSCLNKYSNWFSII
jgi:biotin carboxylase